jgi:hypothetical protein
VTCDLDATSAREVRGLVRELLSGRDGILVDDAVLVVDELASNAHVHARGPRSCRLILIDQDRCVRIEVDDASPAQPRLRNPDRTGGRGLVLVDRLASSWGVRNHGDGDPNRAVRKTVWAEVALDRAGSSDLARHLAVAPPER